MYYVFQQGYRPQSANQNKPRNKIKFEGDFDFEQANNKFEELRSQLAKLKVGDEPNNKTTAATTATTTTTTTTTTTEQVYVLFSFICCLLLFCLIIYNCI